MKMVFADSYYFLAVINDHDEAHLRAIDFAKTYRGLWVTSEWALMEVGDALAQPHRRPSFVQVLQNLQANPRITIVEASHELFGRGVELFAKRTDKAWSLTDCTSFVVMDDLGIQDALTGDHHFEQAGYVALLR